MNNNQNNWKTISISQPEDDDNICPICSEDMDITDKNFRPCTCEFTMCLLCWHHIKENLNGTCPGCRKPYDPENYKFTEPSKKDIEKIAIERNAKKKPRDRKQLADLRVVQRNLMYLTNLPLAIASEETLATEAYCGQYGDIIKIAINKQKLFSTDSPHGPSVSAYITYETNEQATRAIQCLNGTLLDGRQVKASFGTTKYCTFFLKNTQCNNPDCMYLHDFGAEEDSYTKEEMTSRPYLLPEMKPIWPKNLALLERWDREPHQFPTYFDKFGDAPHYKRQFNQSQKQNNSNPQPNSPPHNSDFNSSSSQHSRNNQNISRPPKQHSQKPSLWQTKNNSATSPTASSNNLAPTNNSSPPNNNGDNSANAPPSSSTKTNQPLQWAAVIKKPSRSSSASDSTNTTHLTPSSSASSAPTQNFSKQNNMNNANPSRQISPPSADRKKEFTASSFNTDKKTQSNNLSHQSNSPSHQSNNPSHQSNSLSHQSNSLSHQLTSQTSTQHNKNPKSMGPQASKSAAAPKGKQNNYWAQKEKASIFASTPEDSYNSLGIDQDIAPLTSSMPATEAPSKITSLSALERSSSSSSNNITPSTSLRNAKDPVLEKAAQPVPTFSRFGFPLDNSSASPQTSPGPHHVEPASNDALSWWKSFLPDVNVTISPSLPSDSADHQFSLHLKSDPISHQKPQSPPLTKPTLDLPSTDDSYWNQLNQNQWSKTGLWSDLWNASGQPQNPKQK